MKPENQNEKAQANSTQEKPKCTEADVLLTTHLDIQFTPDGLIMSRTGWAIIPFDGRNTELYCSQAFAQLRAQQLANKSGGKVIR